MKYIYLDNNIIIDLKNDRNEAIKKIVNNFDRSKYRIVFSPAHVEEVAATVKHYGQTLDVAYEKLDFLNEVTSSYCLLPFPRHNLRSVRTNGVYTYVENPRETFIRVFDLYDRNWIPESHQREKLSLGESIEESNDIKSSSVNNSDALELLDKYRDELFRVITINYKELKKNKVMRQYIPKKPINIRMLKAAVLMPYFPMFEMAVEKLMEYLEYSRYYPDKSNKNIASLHDTTHAIYGAYADIFVTNDRRFAHKVRAVYQWLGVSTEVMTRDEFIKQYPVVENIA
ncbi:hypothetical protein M2F98_20975 [Vibrio vulnificus]|nr:hypothetical protein [Vibrio vulnificus]